jgi:transcriptional regulator with XRE-family HTH domain
MARTTRLFEMAAQRGITQAELARLTGIPEATLSRVRRGDRVISLHFMDRVLAALPEWGSEGEMFPREQAERAS